MIICKTTGLECIQCNPGGCEYAEAKKEIINKCAVENVKDHIFVKMCEMELAEKQAIKEGRLQSYIDMCHDSFCLWAGFLAQLS